MKIDSFLGRFTDVVTETDGWIVPCPTHDDSKPSLRVAIGNNGSLLLKCRAGCKTEDVVEGLGLTFAELRNVQTSGAPVARSEAAPASDADVTKLAVQIDDWAEELDSEWAENGEPMGRGARYLADRFGITQAEARSLRLGVADQLGGSVRVVVPFLDPRGVARGYQARALDPSAKVRWLGAKSPLGASWSKLAWLHAGEAYDQIIVTEGPSDALTAVAAGYDAIAVRGAGLVNDERVVAMIADWVGDRQVVVAGDSDQAGAAFSKTLVAHLVRLKRKAFALDVPAADLNEWRKEDPSTFTEKLQAAVKKLATRESKEWDADTLTDLGAAKRYRAFLLAQQSDVKFTVENGFYLLDKGVWLQDTLNRVRTVAHEVAEQVWRDVQDMEVELMSSLEAGLEVKQMASELAVARRFAKHISSKLGIDAALNELAALPGVAISINDLDQHPHLLAALNGTIDLRDRTLHPTDPANLLSRRLSVNFVPDAKAPRWEQFLREIFPAQPDEMPEFMRRLIGYGITGLTDEQCFAVLWGTGANGKSVLTEVLTRVFREVTTTTPFSTFEIKPGGGVPNDIAALKGARLVMASEGEAGKAMAEAMLKRVTGRDMISARFMRQEFFEFLPTFLLMLATNYKPKFRGQDEGLWRRVKLIEFARYFEPNERDPKLHVKLMEEAEGILAWAVSGASDWFSDGSLREPASLRELTASYKFDSDALAGFLPGQFVIDPESAEFVERSVLWDAYQAWCEEEQFGREMRWSQRAFYSALEERGATRGKSGNARGFRAIRPATEDELDEMLAVPTTETRTAVPEVTVAERPVAGPPPSLDDL